MFSSVLRVAPRLLFRSRHIIRTSSHARIIRVPCLYRPQARYLSTPPPQINASTLSMEEYHQLSEETMDALLEELEALLDEAGDPRFEVEYHSGVLTLKLADQGTYVVNKQPPNKQIWLSSPVSGPKRYDYSESDGTWRYSRDNKSLNELLNEELGQTFNKPIDLTLSSKV